MDQREQTRFFQCSHLLTAAIPFGSLRHTAVRNEAGLINSGVLAFKFL